MHLSGKSENLSDKLIGKKNPVNHYVFRDFFLTFAESRLLKYYLLRMRPNRLLTIICGIFLFLYGTRQVSALTLSNQICHFYTADQLSSNLITSICQDKQGFIWVSTEYGLNRFDGVNFTSYFIDDNTKQPLLNNNCRKVICDRDGRVWVISYNGIQYYDRLSNSFPILKLDTEDQSYPTDILELNDGRLLVLTIKKGLFLVDKDKMEAKAWEEANKLYLDESASYL